MAKRIERAVEDSGFRQVGTANGTQILAVRDIHHITNDEYRTYPEYYQGVATVNGEERYVRTGSEHPQNKHGMFYTSDKVSERAP
jgi:hypothetical protein